MFLSLLPYAMESLTFILTYKKINIVIEPLYRMEFDPAQSIKYKTE